MYCCDHLTPEAVEKAYSLIRGKSTYQEKAMAFADFLLDIALYEWVPLEAVYEAITPYAYYVARGVVCLEMGLRVLHKEIDGEFCIRIEP